MRLSVSSLLLAFARLRRRLLTLASNQRGVAAVEFAMLLPVMITLYIGGVEISRMVSVDRKVTLTARSVADLVAQSTTVTNNEMTNILNAANAVLAPYLSANAKVTVSSVKIDADKKATIEWSDTCHGTARAVNSTITLSPALATPNTWLIWAEVSYTYTPIFGGAPTDLLYKLTGPKILQDQIYMRPRLQDSVTRSGASATCS